MVGTWIEQAKGLAENADEFNVDLSVNGTAASGKTYLYLRPARPNWLIRL